MGIVAVCLSIGSPLLGLRVFYPSDLLLEYDPWRSETSEQIAPTNPLLWDPVDSAMPERAEARRRILRGELPLWDPHPSGGIPLTTDPHGLFGPLNLPYFVLPLWLAPALSKLLEMIAAAGFTFLFLRRIGLSRPPAIIGGLLFAFSGFQVVWTNWPHTHVGALIPGLFWAIEYGIERRSLRGAVPLALIVAAMILEGYPPVAGYALVAGALYGVVRTLSLRGATPAERGRSAILLLGGATLGIALTAMQLLPFLERLSQLDLSYRLQSPGLHLPPESAVTVGVPYAFGTLAGGGRYFGPLNEVEIQSFAGMTALVLIACGAAMGRVRASRGAVPYLWVGTGVAVLAIFTGGPVLWALQKLPIFESSFIGRLRSVLGFLLACLAAVGAQALLVEPRGPSSRGRLRVLGVAIVGLGLVVLGIVTIYGSAADANHGGHVLRDVLLPPIVALLAVGGILLGRRLRPLVLWSLPVLIAAESLTFVLPLWPRIPREQFYPVTGVHRFLEENLGHDRLVPEGRTLFPGSTTFYGLRSVTGHAFYEEPWKQLLLAIDPRSFEASPTHPELGWDPDIATSPILDRLSARYFVVSPAAPIPGRSMSLSVPSRTLPLRPGASITRELPAVSPRGVVLDLATPPRNPDRLTAITVEFLDANGSVIAQGWRRIFPEQLGPVEIAVAASVPDETASAVRIHLSAAGEPIDLRADQGGALVASAIETADDGLRVAHVGGAVVYERLQALPRFRWAPRATVIADPRERVRLLSEGVATDTVILSEPGPSPSGRSADVRPLEDGSDVIRVAVDAEGAGYLVIADALQHGWTANLDGRPIPLRAADHALAAVPVPEGRHVVELRYRPEGWRAGLIISGTALVLLATVLLVPLFSSRRERSPGPGGGR